MASRHIPRLGHSRCPAADTCVYFPGPRVPSTLRWAPFKWVGIVILAPLYSSHKSRTHLFVSLPQWPGITSILYSQCPAKSPATNKKQDWWVMHVELELRKTVTQGYVDPSTFFFFKYLQCWAISAVQQVIQSYMYMHTLFFSYYLPSCSVPGDWI